MNWDSEMSCSYLVDVKEEDREVKEDDDEEGQDEDDDQRGEDPQQVLQNAQVVLQPPKAGPFLKGLKDAHLWVKIDGSTAGCTTTDSPN